MGRGSGSRKTRTYDKVEQVENLNYKMKYQSQKKKKI